MSPGYEPLALTPAYLQDTLVNLVSSLGTSKDKGGQGRFTDRAPLTRTEIDTLYSKNWLGGKVVDIPSDDMTREWRSWQGIEKEQVQALEEAERRLRVRQKVNLALKMAAKDGGAAILIGGPGNPWEELKPGDIRRGGLRYLHLVSRYELSITEMELDPESPWVGQAKEYRMIRDSGEDLRIHPSRVVPFIGVPRTDYFFRDDPWGDSVFERIHDAIRDAVAASQAVASMLEEAKLDVIKIPGLSENVVRPDYRAAVLQRFALAMSTKSINNALIFDAAEEWEQKTLTFQGLPEIIETLLQIVAGAADMPVTRLLGRSPAGLNATGQADLEGYYTMVRSRQETALRPPVQRIDEVLIRGTLGRMPRGIFSEWRTLWSVAASDQAEIDYKRAQAIEAYSRAGVFTPEALQAATIAQLEEDSFLNNIAEYVRQFPGAPGNVQLQVQQINAKAAETTSRISAETSVKTTQLSAASSEKIARMKPKPAPARKPAAKRAT